MLLKNIIQTRISLALILPVFMAAACSPDAQDSNKEKETIKAQEVGELVQPPVRAAVQPSSVLQPEVMEKAKANDIQDEDIEPAMSAKVEDVQAATPSPSPAPSPTEASSTPPATPIQVAAKKSDSWLVNKEASKLTFAGTQTGDRFEGQFEKFEASIKFDPDNLEDAKIEILVDMESAKTGDRQRDTSLPAKDWFNIKEHPTALYTSNNIVSVGGDSYEASGILKIRNIEKKILLPFTLTIENDRAIAKGKITIVRTGFEIGQGQWATDEWVGVAVDIGYEIDAKRN